MMPPGRHGTSAARSASACGPCSGLMRTQSRERSGGCAARNAAICPRALGFSPSATASSRSKSTMSASPAAAFSIFRSLSPGAKSQERALTLAVMAAMCPDFSLIGPAHGTGTRRGCRLVAYRLAVFAHLARAPIHVLLGIEHDCLIAAEAAGAGDDPVAALRELRFHRGIEAAFHLHRADAGRCLPRRLRIAIVAPARRIPRFLH